MPNIAKILIRFRGDNSRKNFTKVNCHNYIITRFKNIKRNSKSIKDAVKLYNVIIQHFKLLTINTFSLQSYLSQELKK